MTRRPALLLVPVVIAVLAFGMPSPSSASSEGDAAAKASSAARREHHRVAVAPAATEVRKVFANPDGSFTAELFAEPVQVRQDGRWVRVDTRLRRRPDGTVGPRAIAAALTLSGGGAERPLARLRAQGAAVDLRWPGKLPKPRLKGDTAIYARVLLGVDLRVRATPAGFAPLVIVHNRSAARRVARITLRQRSTGRRAKKVFDVGARGLGKLALTPDRRLMADGGTFHALTLAPPDYNRPIAAAGWAKVMSGKAGSAFWLGGTDGGEAKVGYCGWDYCAGIGTVVQRTLGRPVADRPDRPGHDLEPPAGRLGLARQPQRRLRLQRVVPAQLARVRRHRLGAQPRRRGQWSAHVRARGLRRPQGLRPLRLEEVRLEPGPDRPLRHAAEHAGGPVDGRARVRHRAERAVLADGNAAAAGHRVGPGRRAGGRRLRVVEPRRKPGGRHADRGEVVGQRVQRRGSRGRVRRRLEDRVARTRVGRPGLGAVEPLVRRDGRQPGAAERPASQLDRLPGERDGRSTRRARALHVHP